MNNNRIEFIDIMKGIGIMMVICGHVSQNTSLNIWLYSFHMPMFFFISGITYHISRTDNFIKRKAKSILIPYLIFSLLAFIYWAVIEQRIRSGNISVTKQFIGIFTSQGGESCHIYNMAMWFLPCLFITEVVFHILNSTFKNKKIIYIGLFVFSIIGFILSKYTEIRLIWSIDTMFIAIVFYGVGYLLSNKLIDYKETIKNKPIKYLFTFVFLLISICTAYINGRVDMNNQMYSNYFLYLISAFGGIVFIYLITISVKSKFIKFLGENTLIIMCIHEPIKRVLLKIVSIITSINISEIRENMIGIIGCSILLIICVLPIIFVINNYIPFVLGKAKTINIKLLDSRN